MKIDWAGSGEIYKACEVRFRLFFVMLDLPTWLDGHNVCK